MFFRSISARRRGARRLPLTIEVLEGRDVPAGNVTTAALGPTLWITGDGADNNIEVQQLAGNQYRILGLDGTTVNGSPEVAARGRADLSIDLGSGRDTVTLTAVSVARDARIVNSELVKIRNGSTTVGRDLSVTEGDSTGDVFGSAVVIGSTTVGRDLTVTAGNGTGPHWGNQIVVFATTAGRDMTIAAGDGTSSGGDGNIVTVGSSSAGHDLTATLADGTGGISGNLLQVDTFSAGNDMALATGDATSNSNGNTIVVRAATVVGNLTVATGDATSGRFGNNVNISLGTTVGGDLTVTTGDGIAVGTGVIISRANVLSTTVGHDLAITTGSGVGQVAFDGLVVQNLTTVVTGPDDDLVQVRHSMFLGLATFDAGGGSDVFSDLGGNDFAVPPILTGFEFVY
jgi:hypothetical protein